MVLGALIALFKDDLKALLAFSTVSHLGLLTMLLGFGIPGLLLLLISHIHYLRDQFKNGQLVGLGFIIIIMISYLVEDTLETQSGITFFGSSQANKGALIFIPRGPTTTAYQLVL